MIRTGTETQDGMGGSGLYPGSHTCLVSILVATADPATLTHISDDPLTSRLFSPTALVCFLAAWFPKLCAIAYACCLVHRLSSLPNVSSNHITFAHLSSHRQYAKDASHEFASHARRHRLCLATHLGMLSAAIIYGTMDWVFGFARSNPVPSVNS